MIDMDDESRQACAHDWVVPAVFDRVDFRLRQIKYLVWGHKADATVTRTFPTSEGRASQRLAVEYTFTDEKLGALRAGRRARLFRGRTRAYQVEYLPGFATRPALMATRAWGRLVLSQLDAVGRLEHFRFVARSSGAGRRTKKRRR